MTRTQQLTKHAAAVVVGGLAYAITFLGFSEFACAVGWFVKCSHPIQALPFVAPLLTVVAVIVHAVAAPLVLLLRRLGIDHFLLVVALYSVLGYILPHLWMALTSENSLLKPSLLDVQFLVAGAVLGVTLWLIWFRGSNHPLNTDAGHAPRAG